MNNTYTFDQLLEKFNPDRVITRAEMLELKKHCALHIQTNNTTSNGESKTSNTNIDPALIEQGFKIQERIEEGVEKTKNKLVAIFFGLQDSVVDTLDADVFEDCWGAIQEANPRILGFLCLTKKTEMRDLELVNS